MAYSRIFEIIDGLNVTKGWKSIFKKVHVSFYNNYVHGHRLDVHLWSHSKKYKSLLTPEKIRMSARFNPYGLILGPFYYLFKGIYIKGLILLLFFLILLFLNDITRFLIAFLMLYCALFINLDYFVDKVLKNKDVMSNPLLLEDDIDDVALLRLLAEKMNPVPLLIVIVVFCYPFCMQAYVFHKDNVTIKKDLAEAPVKCSNKTDCLRIVSESMQQITSTKNKDEVSNLYYKAAAAYYELQDRYNAVSMLDFALSFDKRNTHAYILRAKIRYQKNEYILSILDYAEALKINPGATFLNYYIGLDFYALKKYDKAYIYFRRATKHHKEPSYFEAQAYARYQLGDLKGAIADTKKALELYRKKSKGVNTDKILSLEKYLVRVQKELKSLK